MTEGGGEVARERDAALARIKLLEDEMEGHMSVLEAKQMAEGFVVHARHSLPHRSPFRNAVQQGLCAIETPRPCFDRPRAKEVVKCRIAGW